MLLILLNLKEGYTHLEKTVASVNYVKCQNNFDKLVSVLLFFRGSKWKFHPLTI